MGFKGSRTRRELVIAVLITLGVATALLIDTRVESRAYEPVLAAQTVRWAGGSAGGPSAVVPTPTPPGAARER